MLVQFLYMNMYMNMNMYMYMYNKTLHKLFKEWI